MFFFFFDSDNKSEYKILDFISNVLMIEAKEEGRKIAFEKKIDDFVADIYLPEGLNRFTGDSNMPTIVEIESKYNKNDLDQNIRKYRKIYRFIGKIVFIFNDDVVEGRLPDEIDYDTLVLGRSTIVGLANNYHDVLTSSLISDEELSFDFKSDEEVIIKDRNGRTRTSGGGKGTYKLSLASPQNVSDLNEMRFKTSFNDDYEKCALILGNGVSIPFGSDNWPTMIHNMLNNLKPYFIKETQPIEETLSYSNYAISSFVKTTLFASKLSNKYYESLRYSIYRKYNDLMHDENTLVKVIADTKRMCPLLPVLTYNYDTFVERQYYHDYGHNLNYYSGPDYMSKINDHVIHLHGYLSYKNNKKDGIILTDEEYYSTYDSASTSWVVKAQKEILDKHIVLFVGSSMSDLFQMSLINGVKQNHGDNWRCYALLKLDPNKIGLKGTIKLLEYYQKKGIHIIFVDSFEKMPEKLSDILLTRH